jgi:hypothetical protein
MDVTPRRIAAGLTGACVSACVGLSAMGACMEGAPASPGLGDDASSEAADAGADSAAQMGCPPADPVEAGYPMCPSPAPSWNNQVKAIVDTYCAPCHFSGGSGVGKQGYDFSTLAGVHHTPLSTMLTQVYVCGMPEPGVSAPLPPADWETLLQWLECYEPDN